MICPGCKEYTSWRYKKCPMCGIPLPQPEDKLPPQSKETDMGKFYCVDGNIKRESTLMETKRALKIQAERLSIEEVITNHQARLNALIGTCTHSVIFEEPGHTICVACGKIKEPHEHA